MSQYIKCFFHLPFVMQNHFLPDAPSPLIMENNFLTPPPSVHDIINEQPLIASFFSLTDQLSLLMPIISFCFYICKVLQMFHLPRDIQIKVYFIPWPEVSFAQVLILLGLLKIQLYFRAQKLYNCIYYLRNLFGQSHGI